MIRLDGITVFVYESRLDLLQAIIVGPKDTPYENALFLFDIALPSDYPNSPPNLTYICMEKEKMQPNLYTDGNVVRVRRMFSDMIERRVIVPISVGDVVWKGRV